MTTKMQLEVNMTIGDHPYIRSANDLEGRSEKWPVFMTFRTNSTYSDIVGGGSKNIQDYSDIIYGLSLGKMQLQSYYMIILYCNIVVLPKSQKCV
jgi:hypothetical protein